MTNRTLKASAADRLKGTYRSSAGILLPRIERHVMRSLRDTGGIDPGRSSDYMHPSDMSHKDWCGRHDYYRMIGTPVEKEAKANPSFRMENVFAEGHAIHGKYQQWLHEMGGLVGVFQCEACTYEWFTTSPKECPFCRATSIVYREYPLRREVYRVEGHADGAVSLPDLQTLVEIKSIGIRTLAFEAPRLYQRYLDGEKPEDIWFEINRPFGSHMKQGQLYMWMAWPAYEQIVFIYESKFHQQTKEFVVEYNKSLIQPVLETARDVARAFRGGYEPDRPLWAEGPEGKVCSSCSYRRTCWGENDAAQANDPPEQLVRVRRAGSAKRKRQLGKPASGGPA